MAESPDKELDPYSAIAMPSFRLFLAARLFVTLSIQIQGICVGWQIYELTKNPLMLGFIGLAEALPAIAVSLYAGHVADISNRRRLAIYSSLGLFSGLLFLTLANFYLKDKSLLYCIFAAIVMTGLARGFYGPAVFGLLSDIVPRDRLSNAAAWNSAFWQASATLGPILGGFLYNLLGATGTYALSSFLIALSLVCFILLKCRSVIVASSQGVLANIKEGLAFVFNSQIILAAMALDLFAVLFGGAVALLPVFSAEIFHMGPQALGFLRAAPPVGALLTASYLTHSPIQAHAGRILLTAVAGYGLCMIAFGFSGNYYLSLSLLLLSGMLDGVSVYIRGLIYQLSTPDELKGRVSSVNNIFIGSSNEIGEFESGVTAKLMGLIPSVVFGGSMTLLVVLITALKAPDLRRLDMRELYTLKTK